MGVLFIGVSALQTPVGTPEYVQGGVFFDVAINIGSNGNCAALSVMMAWLTL